MLPILVTTGNAGPPSSKPSSSWEARSSTPSTCPWMPCLVSPRYGPRLGPRPGPACLLLLEGPLPWAVDDQKLPSSVARHRLFVSKDSPLSLRCLTSFACGRLCSLSTLTKILSRKLCCQQDTGHAPSRLAFGFPKRSPCYKGVSQVGFSSRCFWLLEVLVGLSLRLTCHNCRTRALNLAEFKPACSTLFIQQR